MRRRLPLFPLDQVVLFPGLHCPLHVFEPRYRQMTEEALAGDGRIGMATVRPEHVHGMAEEPPLFDVGCEGRIVDWSRRSDGRYDILLLGERRFRILEEPPRPPEQLYRVGWVEGLEETEEPGGGVRLAALRGRALELLGELLERLRPGSGSALAAERLPTADDATLVNALCRVAELDPAEKQGLLERSGPEDRARGLVEVLGLRLAELGAGGAPASRRLH